MKDIFRFVGMGALLAVVLGVGSLTVSAQNPCEDYDGNAALDAKIRENYVKDETLEVAVDAAKQYLENTVLARRSRTLQIGSKDSFLAGKRLLLNTRKDCGFANVLPNLMPVFRVKSMTMLTLPEKRF